MEGLQGWMAEIERKQGRLTYFGAAAVLIAILASGAALYFGLTAKSDNSGTKDDIDELSTKIDQLQGAVTKNTEDTQQTLNQTVQQLQSQIAALQQKQAQDAANIATLQSQVAASARRRRPGGRERRRHAWRGHDPRHHDQTVAARTNFPAHAWTRSPPHARLSDFHY